MSEDWLHAGAGTLHHVMPNWESLRGHQEQHLQRSLHITMHLTRMGMPLRLFNPEGW